MEIPVYGLQRDVGKQKATFLQVATGVIHMQPAAKRYRMVLCLMETQSSG